MSEGWIALPLAHPTRPLPPDAEVNVPPRDLRVWVAITSCESQRMALARLVHAHRDDITWEFVNEADGPCCCERVTHWRRLPLLPGPL